MSTAQMTGAAPTISRRDVLRGAVLGAAALALGACGSSTLPSVGRGSTVPASSTPPPSVGSSPAVTPIPSPASSPSAAASPTAGPDLTLHEKIAGLMVVGFRGSTIGQVSWLQVALRDLGLGGVILFDRDQMTGADRNVLSARQVTALIADLRAEAGNRRIIVSVDQEGGVVTRLSPTHGFAAVASEAAIGMGTVARAQLWGRGIARTLSSAGFDLNFAPVVDLDVDPRSPAIGALDRSFSANPDIVVKMATAEIDAHRAAGVRTTLKHFPGIGSSTTNTDFGVADVTATWTRTELEPFRRLIAAGKADVIMAGHVVNGQLDAARPASLSKAVVTGLLRGGLGWDGVVVTDDLQAKAIDAAFGRDEAVILALEAGNDLLLFANQQIYDPGIVSRVVSVVVEAVDSGRLPVARIDEAWGRIQRLFGGTAG